MTTTVLAWHGSQILKNEVMARLRQHRAEDAIVQGVYQRVDPDLAAGYKGCAIGCTLPLQDGIRSWHHEVERQYGIPAPIGLLIDDTFEGLTPPAHAEFAVDVIDAVPVAADLTKVVDRVALDVLSMQRPGVTELATEPTLAAVAALVRRRLAGDNPLLLEWRQDVDKIRERGNAIRREGSHAEDAAVWFTAYSYTTDPLAKSRAFGTDPTFIAQRLIHHLSTAPVPAVFR